MLIIETIIIDVFIISFIYILFIIIGLQLNNKQTTQTVQKVQTQQTKTEEDKSFYLRLLNTSTQEILTFKNKKEFIDTIEGFDTIKYFLKGTEEQNTNQLIKWYYPDYKKL